MQADAGGYFECEATNEVAAFCSEHLSKSEIYLLPLTRHHALMLRSMSSPLVRLQKRLQTSEGRVMWPES